MTPAQIKRVRRRLGLSQTELAALVGFNPNTLRNWEQGVNSPSGAANALLVILDREPEAAMRALRARGRRGR